jgi:hypothetical protein
MAKQKERVEISHICVILEIDQSNTVGNLYETPHT